MKHLKYYNILILIIFLLGTISSSCQNTPNQESKLRDQEFPIKPKLGNLLDSFLVPQGYVSDYENLFTKAEIYILDSILYNFEKETTLQVILVTLDSNIASSSEFDRVIATLGNGWKVGGDSSLGTIIGISASNKRIRIENGYKIRPFISDVESQDVINAQFVPNFKKAQFFKGTLSGVSILLETLRKNLKERSKVTF